MESKHGLAPNDDGGRFKQNSSTGLLLPRKLYPSLGQKLDPNIL
jgi:hypothetical protein